MPYIPLHDQQSYLTSIANNQNLPQSPRYASPDLDPKAIYDWTRQPQMSTNEISSKVGPSRKRPRVEDSHPRSNDNYSDHQNHNNGHHLPPNIPIAPSIFGISPRNEFTKVVGEFLMEHCRNHQNVEIEIKLGTLMAIDGSRRIRMPALNETIMPFDYPVGNFISNMVKTQHTALNKLLNSATETSIHSPSPISFKRAQHSDSFYGHGNRESGKVRVSRDRNGNIIPGGIIKKKRIADLNVYSPREAFDWRVSVSIEDPCEMPPGNPTMVRDKDRACYKHQACQIDLTVVSSKIGVDDTPTTSYELEIEIIDVPGLLAEGEKENQGVDNRFDEILQSCLDSVRMLIRNVDT